MILKHVFAIQSTLLDIPFRLWTPFTAGKESRLKWRIARTLLLVYWIWCFIILIFMALKAGESVLFEPHGSKISPIVRVLAGIPNFFLTLRGNLVLLILAVRKDTMAELLQNMECLVYKFVPGNSSRSKTRKWLALNSGLTLYCLTMFAAIQILSWTHGLEFEKYTLNSYYSLNPLPFIIPVWVFITFQVCFMYCPYFLSQVLLSGTIVMGSIMDDCSRILNKKLKSLDERFRGLVECSKATGKQWVIGLDEMDSLAGEVELLIADRAALFQFNEKLNSYFGWLLFVSYVSDVCASAGMLAVLVADAEPSHYQFAAKLLGAIGFLSFATVLYIPLALSTESASKTASYVYIATNTAYPLFGKNYSIRLREVLNDLRSMSTTFPIDFLASGFFHIERRFIVTTITLLASFGILLVEFLGNEESIKGRPATIDLSSILNVTGLGSAIFKNPQNDTTIKLVPHKHE
ncbi:hypothetical protein BV898_12643 [Hypsibius exemplaris]|uniref:Odorant receptor n=1 Tax=Hypsibius exemplaris TaxID=2072580 RepID=A0A1W0WD92_HYPEX|nr:hypothetical protein BV898_12643 [Hypsibius exemplaris]